MESKINFHLNKHQKYLMQATSAADLLHEIILKEKNYAFAKWQLFSIKAKSIDGEKGA